MELCWLRKTKNPLSRDCGCSWFDMTLHKPAHLGTTPPWRVDRCHGHATDIERWLFILLASSPGTCVHRAPHCFFFFSFLFTVRSGAEERTFLGARLDVLIFRLRSYHVLISYSAESNGPTFYKILMFLGQAGMFLSFQARRSSATRSSTSDLTVLGKHNRPEPTAKSCIKAAAYVEICNFLVRLLFEGGLYWYPLFKVRMTKSVNLKRSGTWKSVTWHWECYNFGMRKAVGFSPTLMTFSGLFRAAAFIRVRLMWLEFGKSAASIRVLLTGKCGFFTQFYGTYRAPEIVGNSLNLWQWRTIVFSFLSRIRWYYHLDRNARTSKSEKSKFRQGRLL